MSASGNGTSVIGHQRLIDFQQSDTYSVQVDFPTQPKDKYVRVGYLYVAVVYSQFPNDTFIIARQPIYRPGIWLKITDFFGSTNYRYTVDATWDFDGLIWHAFLS